jgi:hypothetical protein
VNCVGLLLALLVALPVRADEPVTISEAKKDDNGVLVHEVRSPFQAKTTQIRVLLPSKAEKGKTYPVVYVLPVEAGTEIPLRGRAEGGPETRPAQHAQSGLRGPDVHAPALVRRPPDQARDPPGEPPAQGRRPIHRQDHQQAHALLDKLKVAHEYRDEPDRKHDWHSGWVKEAAELLVAK